MKISIANLAQAVPDTQFRSVVHAIERQVHEDFGPLWGMDAQIRLAAANLNEAPTEDVKLSDIVVYLAEAAHSPDPGKDVLGYHSRNLDGMPFGVVFTDVTAQFGEPWSATLSHEVLELLADPEVNLMVVAQHPERPSEMVLRPYEVCDPVQSNLYSIDGVAVSNFVLPLYFAQANHPSHARTNFLGLKLERFGVLPGGYFSYFDFTDGKFHDVLGDREGAPQLAEAKRRLVLTRRQSRRVMALRDLPKARSR
ncbi:MAG TPA: hypothetical protein VFA20_16995 [Myxococcaceae bacterium]|nr:hypothetical protein [Myxococcaceae bacterium]